MQAWLDEIEPTKPAIDTQVGIIADAYCDLQTERSIGMAVGPIPFTAVLTWAAFYGLDHDATIFLRRTLRVVENEMAEKKL